MMEIINLSIGKDYKVGDQPPSDYLGWHEWADIQYAGGLRQCQCGKCGKYKFPQELSDKEVTSHLMDRRGKVRAITSKICKECD